MGNLNLDPKVWLEEMFEFECCPECNGDAKNHDAIPFMGNWFARCRVDEYEDTEMELVTFCKCPCDCGCVETPLTQNMPFRDGFCVECIEHNHEILPRKCPRLNII